MRQVRRKERGENESLNEGVEIVGQQTIEDDLPLGKRAGEDKFNVRRLKHQPPLPEALDERAPEHEEGARDQDITLNEVAEDFVVPKPEQHTERPQNVGEPDEGRGPAQADRKS